MEIAHKRQERLARLGGEEGFTIPPTREVSVVEFAPIDRAILICEVKRRSPSKGSIDTIPSAAHQAELYHSHGATHISVLTEPDYFGGSLQDLMDVKKAYPQLAVLRKDFLLSLEDIEVSYRAGADGVLLIASLLEQDLLKAMYRRCQELRIDALVELHSLEDIQKVAPLQPRLVGINCRNLKDFSMNPLQPLKIRSLIDWECSVIYESGVLTVEDGRFVVNAGFQGMLVGEGVVRNPLLIAELTKELRPFKGIRRLQMVGPFPKTPWEKLYTHWKPNRPLIKVCGLTRVEDFNLAVDLGAALCGFVLAPSPRKAEIEFIRSLPPSNVVKVGVVVLGEEELLPEEIQALLQEGYLDMIQYHGNELPQTIQKNHAIPGYKAVRIQASQDLTAIPNYSPYPVLIDAFDQKVQGGSGTQIRPELVEQAKAYGDLWLAGGITPESVGSILSNFQPDLIDLSSGLEENPGKKSREKMQRFFKEVEAHG